VDKTQPVPGAAPIGMALFLLSLGMLFAASLVAYFAVRFNDAGLANWNPDGVTGLPNSLWASTFVLVISSITMHYALTSARADDQPGVRWGMFFTTLLGAVFLATQAWSWRELYAMQVDATSSLYGWTFYMLTALHGLHIVGGLIPLAVTTVRAKRGAYTAAEHTGVTLCAMYWHFLDAVWIVLFANLMLFS